MRTCIVGICIAAAVAISWSPASAQERSFLCKFTSGPRTGQIQDYTGHPAGALPVGSSCQDGNGSSGIIISSQGGGGSGSGSPGGSGGGTTGTGSGSGGYPH